MMLTESSELLKYLLSGEDPETVVQKIHEHLRTLAENMRAYSIPARKYTIYTQLGKNPKDYPNGNSMPSVQVALRLMEKGKHVKAKDVMSFIITGDSSGSAEAAAKNAHPVDEVIKPGSDLKPDIDYYLHKQILPPVERLCAPIGGTNITMLAACLGLDTSKYRLSSASGSANAQDVEIQYPSLLDRLELIERLKRVSSPTQLHVSPTAPPGPRKAGCGPYICTIADLPLQHGHRDGASDSRPSSQDRPNTHR